MTSKIRPLRSFTNKFTAEYDDFSLIYGRCDNSAVKLKLYCSTRVPLPGGSHSTMEITSWRLYGYTRILCTVRLIFQHKKNLVSYS